MRDETDSRATTAARRYLPALDGLRAFAVVAVMASHALPQLETLGLGVDIFFVISGYLITSILADEHNRTSSIDLRRFYRRRMARLYPALALVCVVTALIFSVVDLTANDATVTGAVIGLVYGTAFAHILDVDVGWLRHLWSLSVEEIFYLFWPLVFLGKPSEARRSRRILTVGAVAVSWHLVLLFIADESWLYNGPDSRAPQILAGAALFVLVDRLPSDRVITLAAVAASAWLAVDVVIHPLSLNQGQLLTTAAAGTALAAYAIRNPDGAVLSHPAMVWIGQRSYSLYLVHLPLFGLHADSWSPTLDRSVRALAFLASFGVAEVLYRYWERPLRARLAGPRAEPTGARRVSAPTGGDR